MKELEDLLQVLVETLNRKEAELENAQTTFSAHVRGAFENEKKKVADFKYGISQVSNDPTLKSTIIPNFRKTADGILTRINAIVVN